MLSLSTNASHKDEIVFFPPQGITSSTSKPKNIELNFFIILPKNSSILLLQDAACEIGDTY